VVLRWRDAAVAALVPLALLAVTAGCGRADAGAKPQPSGAQAQPFQWPAATQGGACAYLDFAAVAQTIGVTFDVAAKGQSGETYSCVLQRAGGRSVPDLTLAVSGTTADAAVFRATVTPKGATEVKDFGMLAYALPVAAAGDAGPGIEVGWLSGDGRLYVLRYRSAKDAPIDPAALTPKMAELAHKVDVATA
jgi:hypothetical protein